MEIPSIVYILVGIMMVITSYVLGSKRDSSSLAVFIFAGAIMLLVGIVKALIKKPNSRQSQHTESKRPLYCGFCGSPMGSFDSFCRNCGSKFSGK